jgi:hypothetical protein
VTVHDSLLVKSVSGLSVKLVGPPLTAAVWAPLAVQLIVNQLPATSTGSPNVMVTSAFGATPAAPAAGDVPETDGADSALQKWSVACELRGAGTAVAKSLALLSVSVQPDSARRAAVVLESVGAAAVSEKFALP